MDATGAPPLAASPGPERGQGDGSAASTAQLPLAAGAASATLEQLHSQLVALGSRAAVARRLHELDSPPSSPGQGSPRASMSASGNSTPRRSALRKPSAESDPGGSSIGSHANSLSPGSPPKRAVVVGPSPPRTRPSSSHTRRLVSWPRDDNGAPGSGGASPAGSASPLKETATAPAAAAPQPHTQPLTAALTPLPPQQQLVPSAFYSPASSTASGQAGRAASQPTTPGSQRRWTATAASPAQQQPQAEGSRGGSSAASPAASVHSSSAPQQPAVQLSGSRMDSPGSVGGTAAGALRAAPATAPAVWVVDSPPAAPSVPRSRPGAWEGAAAAAAAEFAGASVGTVPPAAASMQPREQQQQGQAPGEELEGGWSGLDTLLAANGFSTLSTSGG